MENKKEMTIPNVSAATDAEQSLSKCTDNSIVNQDIRYQNSRTHDGRKVSLWKETEQTA